jgi:predicted ATPase
MLLSFTVENFRGFRDPAELSMRRADVEPDSGMDQGWYPQISTLAAVYGPNASGKSTLVEAVRYAVRAVRDSFTEWKVCGGTGVTPFILDETHPQQPSRFELQVRASDGLEYQYWFELDRDRVLREELYIFRTARRSRLFARDAHDVRFGDSFTGARAPVLEAIRARGNALALSVMTQFGNESLKAVFEAITGIQVLDAGAYRQGFPLVAHMIEQHEYLLPQLVQFIKGADIGVANVRIETPDAVLIARIEEQLASFGLPQENVHRIAEDSSKLPVLEHQGSGGRLVPVPYDAESQGTVAMLAFAPVLLAALGSGGVVVIDEIDTSLHPDMVREIVGLFAKRRSNPGQAQLVFTTHDTNLLRHATDDDPLLDRDQVWVTEKDVRDGSCALTAVAEYSPRRSESLERGYRTGRYGGIPTLAVKEYVAAVMGSGE